MPAQPTSRASAPAAVTAPVQPAPAPVQSASAGQSGRATPPAATAEAPSGTAPDQPAQPSRWSRLTDAALDHGGKLPTLTYWRVRLTRWLLTTAITLFGLNRLRSWSSRWLGFIPGPLQGLDDMDRWLQLTDPARLKALRGRRPAGADAAREPVSATTVDVRGSVPGARQGDTALAIRLKTLNEQHRSRPLELRELEQQLGAVETPRLPDFATLSLAQSVLSVEPGQVVSTRLIVASGSHKVERVLLRVIGLPEAWLSLTPYVSLLPGSVGEGEIQINPPRHHSSLAGAHYFAVEGCADDLSEAQPRRILAYGVLLIGPFSEFQGDLRPNQQPGWRDAVYNLVISNNGNHAQEYLLEGRDDDELMAFRFAQARVMVLPGKQRQVRTEVRLGRWHWFGMQRIYLFQLKVSPVDAPTLQPLQAFGRFVQHPLLTLLTIIGLLLLLAICLAPLALRLLAAPVATPTPTLQPTTALPTATPTITPTATLQPTQEPPTPAPPTLEPPTPALPTPVPPTPAPPTPVPPTPAPPTLVPTITPTALADLIAVPGRPINLPVEGPPSMAFLVYFDDRPVGGGSIDQNGRGVIVVTTGIEQQGLHRIVVRERGGTRVLLTRSIYMPAVTPTATLAVPRDLREP